MELIDYARMLARRWPWVVALTLLGITGGHAWATASPKVYQASSELFVGSIVLGGSDATSAAAQSASQFTLGRMQSYAALVGSPGVTRGRSQAERLGLTDEQFAQRVYATVPPQTVILRVFGFDRDPARAADIANVAAERLSDVIEDLEASANGGRSPVDVSVTRAAVPPSAPVSPNRKTLLGLGLVLGLGSGLLAAALRDQTAHGGRRAGPAAAPAATPEPESTRGPAAAPRNDPAPHAPTTPAALSPAARVAQVHATSPTAAASVEGSDGAAGAPAPVRLGPTAARRSRDDAPSSDAQTDDAQTDDARAGGARAEGARALSATTNDATAGDAAAEDPAQAEAGSDQVEPSSPAGAARAPRASWQQPGNADADLTPSVATVAAAAGVAGGVSRALRQRGSNFAPVEPAPDARPDEAPRDVPRTAAEDDGLSA